MKISEAGNDSIHLSIFCLCCSNIQIIKDGMQHVGKLICSNLGARMDSEPKRWRIFGLHLGWSLFLLVLALSYHFHKVSDCNKPSILQLTCSMI